MTQYFKKYRPTKRQLSHKTANSIFQCCQQAMQAETENIIYWKQRLNKPISQLDNFILMTDKFTPEMAIATSQERINYLMDKMNDMRKFFMEGEKIRKIF
mgnify:CR=1 FL=1